MLQYAWQSVSGCFAMCFEAWGTSRGPYTRADTICGHVHLTVDVSQYPVQTSGGPQAPPNGAKRFNMHGRVLLDALGSVCLLGMSL